MNEFENFNIEQFVAQVNKDRKEREIFWNSELCLKMINDFIKTNKSLNDEFFLYFPEEVKQTYNWNEVSNEDIRKFIDVMADNYIGLNKNEELKIDKNCPFENYSFTKKGVTVFIMHGQGTSITLKPSI